MPCLGVGAICFGSCDLCAAVSARERALWPASWRASVTGVLGRHLFAFTSACVGFVWRRLAASETVWSGPPAATKWTPLPRGGASDVDDDAASAAWRALYGNAFARAPARSTNNLWEVELADPRSGTLLLLHARTRAA